VGITIKKGIVFDIKKYAVDDGPGIRSTIFFKGCPLRCWWCHNPEGQVMTPELMYRRSRCIKCGECVKACPYKAITLGANRMSISRKLCSSCGECSQECPTGALAVVGKETSVEEVMKEIDKDAVFYGESEGGVTFSGGEPLLQFDFLNALLDECKDRSIHTAVDTCGHASPEAVEKISHKVDLFLYDIKLMHDKDHEKYTGMSNKQILRNFEMLAENGRDLLVRFPIIPAINDSKENVAKTAEFILSHGVKRICLLPYHRAGTEKYRSLGRRYKLKETKSPSDQELMKIRRRLETFGLDVRIGGG
jgi:pyruvate formate lyase activating enzyme